MLDKQLEQLGEIIAAKHSELAERTASEIASGIESIRADQRIETDTIYKMVSDIAETVNAAEKEVGLLSFASVGHIAMIDKSIAAQRLFEHQIDSRVLTIRDGENGQDGLPGKPGVDGLDRPLIEPVELKDGKDYGKNTLGTFAGGLWISKKQATGSPEDDPHAWHCILDSLTDVSVDLEEDHSYKLSARMSTGKVIENRFRIPYPEHKGIWEAGSYTQGQIVTKGYSFWQAMEDTSGEPPGNGWKQILTAPRGKQGEAGKSVEGPQGKPGRNGLDAKLPANFVDDVLSIAGKAFVDGRSSAEAITSFRGYFNASESYHRGDVVNLDGSLYLATGAVRPARTLGENRDRWQVMLSVYTGGSGQQLSAEQFAWVGASASPLTYGDTLTVGQDWSEVGRRSIDVGSAFAVKFNLVAKRIDSLAYHTSAWSALAVNDGVVSVYSQQESELGINLSARVSGSGNNFVIQVKGRPNEEWDWKLTAFYRELP